MQGKHYIVSVPTCDEKLTYKLIVNNAAVIEMRPDKVVMYGEQSDLVEYYEVYVEVLRFY